MRDPLTVVIGCRDSFVFSREKARSTVPTTDAPQMSQVLQQLIAPTPGSVILDSVGHALDGPVDDGMVIGDRRADPLLAARDRVFSDNRGYHFVPGPSQCGHLVLALTGSVVSGLMAPFVLSLGHSQFHQRLDLIVTPSARKFVQAELFEYYGIRTWTDPFARREGVPVPHILLGKSADLVLVMPATADSIRRLATGSCEDLLSLVVAATDAPVVVAPCMNTAMWNHPAVRRNVDQLRADGSYVIEPSFFFEAAELVHGAKPGYGMTGVFWGGPASLMDALTSVLELHSSQG